MSRFLLGLTGGIAAGKSTVAELLRQAGIEVVDADRLVAELYRPGGDGAEAVRELFGPALLRQDGGVDHDRLASKIFTDPLARQRLEARIHPLVRRRFRELAAEPGGVLALEAALLAETGYASEFDLVVTVEASPEVRLRRAAARGLDDDDARARLGAQDNGARRLAVADLVIRNDGDREQLAAQVRALLRRIAERVAAGGSDGGR